MLNQWNFYLNCLLLIGNGRLGVGGISGLVALAVCVCGCLSVVSVIRALRGEYWLALAAFIASYF